MARLLCDNVDGIRVMQPQAFRLVGEGYVLVLYALNLVDRAPIRNLIHIWIIIWLMRGNKFLLESDLFGHACENFEENKNKYLNI